MKCILCMYLLYVCEFSCHLSTPESHWHLESDSLCLPASNIVNRPEFNSVWWDKSQTKIRHDSSSHASWGFFGIDILYKEWTLLYTHYYCFALVSILLFGIWSVLNNYCLEFVSQGNCLVIPVEEIRHAEFSPSRTCRLEGCSSTLLASPLSRGILLALIFFCTAHEAGHFNAEIAPIDVKAKKGKVPMTYDEHPRPQTTLEQMAKLPTVFKKGGTVTAANASVSVQAAASNFLTEKWSLDDAAEITNLGVFLVL